MNKMTTLTHRNSDNASQLAYSGATDFNGVRNQEYPLTYNESGSLVSDAGRNIANIEYDNLNNPIRIQFTNGNVTKYIYSAAGEKLRVIYQTAVPNISVAIGSTRELTHSETLYTDSIDYLLGGALTLRNGKVDKYQFDEGYCQVSSSTSTTDTFILFYYEKDHLGNIRNVRKVNRTRNGEVVQGSNYYPFGAEFCDGNANTSVQSRKYNGKEFDNMHGLNTYDYGARQYNPVTARWDRVDPLAHEYYSVSPYVYCMNNPVIFVDPDGRNPIDLIKLSGLILEVQSKDHNLKTVGYAINHPFNAYKTGSATWTGSISNIASNFEINIASGAGLTYRQPGDQGNAIRHTLWQSILTTEFGEAQAKRIGYIHEDGNASSYSNNIYLRLEDADACADLRNNIIGRSIGKANMNADNKTLAKKVLQVYHDKGLYVVRSHNGKYIVKLERISDKQYQKALQIIDKKNNNGLNK